MASPGSESSSSDQASSNPDDISVNVWKSPSEQCDDVKLSCSSPSKLISDEYCSSGGVQSKGVAPSSAGCFTETEQDDVRGFSEDISCENSGAIGSLPKSILREYAISAGVEKVYSKSESAKMSPSDSNSPVAPSAENVLQTSLSSASSSAHVCERG